MTPRDVLEAIAGKIAQLWPDRMLYRDFCPVDFQRPSGYLWLEKQGFEPANACMVRWNMDAVLELFCATDAYDIQSTEELASDQEKVLCAFGGISIPVRDRHVQVLAVGDGMEAGSAYVRFSVTWFDAPPSLDTPVETAPLMEHFEVKICERSE